MKDHCLSLKDERNNLVAKVSMTKNRMFLLNLQTDVAKCLKSSVKDMSWHWNMRLGHVNFGGLKMMVQKKMVHGLPSFNHPDQLCEGCQVGKQSRKPFPKESILRAMEPLQLVHTDICDPIKPASFGKNQVFFAFH